MTLRAWFPRLIGLVEDTSKRVDSREMTDDEHGGMCGRCYDDDVALYPANCAEKPEKLIGLPMGQYHCPDCGAMVIAGMPHFDLCQLCLDRQHPSFDATETQ